MKALQAVILAAGSGTRLYPITKERSKAMLPILGKPITERIMEQMVAAGLNNFILVSDPNDEELQQYFTDKIGLKAPIRIVLQKEPLGMAHALQCAAPYIDEDFFLSACDNLTSPGHIKNMLSEWNNAPRLNGLLSIMPVERDRLHQVGVVDMDGPWINKIVEKPSPGSATSNLSSLPLYVFSARLLQYLSKIPKSVRGEYEIQSAIQYLIDRDGYVKGFPTRHRLTLTHPQDLITINVAYLTAGNLAPHDRLEKIGPNTKVFPPVYVESGTFIGSHCIIGPNVYIEKDCIIGDQVRITNSVILRRSSVADYESVIDRVVY